MKILGVIPARLESTRLARKMLRDIGGKPLVQHVYENVKQARSLDDLVVACDDLEILKAVERAGGKAILTRTDHQSGTERIREVAQKIPADVYVNIQGDEPLMSGANVDLLVQSFKHRDEFLVGTLAIRKSEKEDFSNPNVVKVVFGQAGEALYFSRSPIPFTRESQDNGRFHFWKHLGIYTYRSGFWKRYSGFKPSWLEGQEKLEQLRFLENGIRIQVVETKLDSIGVDTEADLERVRGLLDAEVKKRSVNA